MLTLFVEQQNNVPLFGFNKSKFLQFLLLTTKQLPIEKNEHRIFWLSGGLAQRNPPHESIQKAV